MCGHRGGVSPPVGPGGHIGKLLLSLQGLHLHKYYVYIFTGHIYIRQRRDDVHKVDNTCMNNFDHSKHLERPSSDEAFQILPLTLTSHIRY